MNANDIERLVRRLEAGDIAACEFDDADGARLVLRLAPRAGVQMVADPQTAAAPASLPSVAACVRAPRFGLYLHRHPLSDVGQVEVGQAFQAGAILGFIQAGEQLVPVSAPVAGAVQQMLAAHGELVGHGQELIRVD